jgi:YD repeat-containing protein
MRRVRVLEVAGRRFTGWPTSAAKSLGLLTGLGLLVQVPAAIEPGNTPAELPLVRTPQNVQVNRRLPDFVPLSQAQPLSDDPSDEEIGRLHLFANRIVPVEEVSSHSVLSGVKSLFTSKKLAAPAVQSNKDIAATLRALQQSRSPLETTQIEAFLKANPQSRWAPALRHELSQRQFRQGRFTAAVSGWDALWEELKVRQDGGAVEVANEAVSQLLDAYLGLGKADRLAALIGDQESRPGNPVIMAKILRARQAVWLLKHKGAQNVMCGPVALYCMLKHNHTPFVPIRLNDITDDYIATGISLSQLKKYSDHYKMGLVMARKPPGQPIPTPAVMHLSTDHYSAITCETNGSYFLEDRPMQFQGWVSLQALEAQGSGYFLIKSNSVPTGWQAVSDQEGSRVFGRDGLHGQEPFSQSVTPCSPQTGGDGPTCRGMPTYTFFPQIAALKVQDTPVGYRAPVGPPVFAKIAYNDLDDSKPVGLPTFPNVGRMWSLNWVAYVDVYIYGSCPGDQFFVATTIHLPGGGTEPLYGSTPSDRSFATDIVTWHTGVGTCDTYVNGLIRTYPDGTQEVYGGGTLGGFPAVVQYFLSKRIDPAGNTVSFTYDSNNRLVAVTDAIGQVTALEYNWPGDMWKITKITDPFGRFATFAYNGYSNELSSVTDVLGLTSTFTYDTNEFVTSMTTPYGTTTFANNRPVNPLISYDYSLTATDPAGDREKVHYVEPIDVPPLGPPLPSSINVGGTNVPFIAEDARLSFRNSFYWNKHAMKQGPDDFAVARNYRWLTDYNYLITPIIEAIKEPLENRVWYNYPGQVGGSDYASYPYYAGGGSRPEKTLRMLSDGSAQLTQTYYNPLGHLANVVDPLGRTTIYNYGTNMVDLVEVRQKTGISTSDRVALFTYNGQHLPLTAVDAAGQTNTFSYNARGQLIAATDPLGATTTLKYDGNGYLLSVDGPLPGTSDAASCTYDGFGRPRMVTFPDGYAIIFDYDAMDRITVITYPDGTYEQFTYERLDRTVVRDRLGRQTHYTYNHLRQLTQLQDPLNRITKFGWCGCGSLESLTDPLERTTTWQYDFQNRIIAKQYADGSHITYNYDSGTSRLKSVVDEYGQIKSYDYNSDDTLRRTSYPNAQVSTFPVSFSYEASYKRLHGMQDAVGLTTWTYRPAGVLGALNVSTISGPWSNAIVNYEYDLLGRATNRSISGIAEICAYDVLGRITNVVNALAVC